MAGTTRLAAQVRSELIKAQSTDDLHSILVNTLTENFEKVSGCTTMDHDESAVMEKMGKFSQRAFHLTPSEADGLNFYIMLEPHQVEQLTTNEYLTEAEVDTFLRFQEKSLGHNFLPVDQNDVRDALEGLTAAMELYPNAEMHTLVKGEILERMKVTDVNDATQEVVQSLIRRHDARLTAFGLAVEEATREMARVTNKDKPYATKIKSDDSVSQKPLAR